MTDDRRPSAYDLPPERVTLDPDAQRDAIAWWQSGSHYLPLTCPVCAAILTLAPQGAVLTCPTRWCSYRSDEIPWGVYVAWQQQQKMNAP